MSEPGRSLGRSAALAAAMALLAVSILCGQGETTSSLTGQITDPSGAAIPRAHVSVREAKTGLIRKTGTDEAGRFSFAQLKPGDYVIEAGADGFDRDTHGPLPVRLGQTQTIALSLRVQSNQTRVDVAAEAPLINTQNPNTTTTLAARAIADLPNPGSDLTYLAQFSPGALINTAGSANDFVGGQSGYGNVQFNGLPALSNAFIVDGLETNDPMTNLNSGLSTNLVLGMNSIAEVSVNTTSYAVDQGRYGAAQVNYVTKSGTNTFHGNLYELWNGSRLNAANFFAPAYSGGRKPRSTVNHYDGSLGGPIAKDRLFFFFDFEQMRIALPVFRTVTVPSAAFQNLVLNQLPKGGLDTITGAIYPAAPALVPFYQKMFSLYGNASGTPLSVLGCPINADGGPVPGTPPNGNGCASRRNVSLSSGSREQVVTARIDHNINVSNMAWYRFQADTGLQGAYTDPISPVFNAYSPQPLYSFAAGYTRVIRQNVVNYFNPAFSWYSSIFEPKDPSKTVAAFPIVLQGQGSNAPFTQLGGLDYNWPQGRKVARFILNESLAWTRGSHDLKFGGSIRYMRANNYNLSTYVTPLVTYTTLPQFIHGVASTVTRAFPVAASQPFSLVNLDLFAQDTVRVTPTVTLTFGVRAAWNSNPVNGHNSVSRLVADFQAMPHDPSAPLNTAAIQTGLNPFYASTPPLAWQPRTSVAWQVAKNSVLRAGFGVFADILPGSIADLVMSNPPNVSIFQGGLLGQAGGVAIAPGVPNSAVDATQEANQAFLAGFRGGALSCGSVATGAACLPPVAFTAVPADRLRAPYFMQWSLGVERQLGANASARVQYVGTRAVQLPYQVQVNGYQTACEGCFQPFPYGAPRDPRFAAVTQLTTGANSNYNGLQTTFQKRFSRGLQITANHTWSHCLDTVSNGGFLPFSSQGLLSPLPGMLQRQYGNCDYDVRHNLNVAYVYELPVKTRKPGFGLFVNGWQISGTLFWHGGIPFTVLSAPYTANGNGILQGSGPQFAGVRTGVPLYRKSPIPGITQPGTLQWLNPDAFVSVVDATTGACSGGDNPAHCQFGNLGRNTLRGPAFFWSDLDVSKRFRLTERIALKFDAQFFNVLNHPNFTMPTNIAGIPGRPETQTGFGALVSTTSPPTGLLGVGLGGDNSPRMVALQMRLEF